MRESRKKILAKLFGNWGIAFFGPLVGSNAAEGMFEVSLTFQQELIIAFFSSLLVMGLFLSREVEKYGQN